MRFFNASTTATQILALVDSRTKVIRQPALHFQMEEGIVHKKSATFHPRIHALAEMFSITRYADSFMIRSHCRTFLFLLYLLAQFIQWKA